MHCFKKIFSTSEHRSGKLSLMHNEQHNVFQKYKYHTPGVVVLVLFGMHGHIKLPAKMDYFFKNLLYPWAWIKQTKI